MHRLLSKCTEQKVRLGDLQYVLRHVKCAQRQSASPPTDQDRAGYQQIACTRHALEEQLVLGIPGANSGTWLSLGGSAAQTP